MTISLSPFSRTNEKVLNELKSEVPEGDAYGITSYAISVPYSNYGYDFVLEVSASAITEITRVQIKTNAGVRPAGFESDLAFIPGSTKSMVRLKLGKGVNYIKVYNDIDGSAEYLIGASVMGLMHEAIAIDIYERLVEPLDTHEADIFNPLSSKLIEWLLPFTDMLPDVRTPRMLATRVIMRTLLHETATKQGVVDFLSAFGYNNPIFVDQLNNGESKETAVYPMFKTSQGFSGNEVHVWLPNICQDRWTVFVRMINNIREVFSLQSITEEEILYKFNSEFVLGEGFNEDAAVQRRERFLATGMACSLYGLSSIDCMSASVYVTVETTSTAIFCAAQYPFDVVVSNLLNTPATEPVQPDQILESYEVSSGTSELIPISAQYTQVIGANSSAVYTHTNDFAFPFDDSSSATMYICGAGYVELGANVLAGSVDGTKLFATSSSGTKVLAPWWGPVKTAITVGYVRIANRGSYPNRYLVIEWKVYLHSSDTAINNDTAVFQAVLHENGDVEFRYAEKETTGAPVSAVSAAVGARSGELGSVGRCWEFTTNVFSPAASVMNARADYAALSYMFIPNVVAPVIDDPYYPDGEYWLGFSLSPTVDGGKCFDTSLGYCDADAESVELEECCGGFAVTPLIVNYGEPQIVDIVSTDYEFGHIDVPASLIGAGEYMT